MHMKPFFSIVIPIYNVAPYLGECLDSLLAQTCPDWEALCVDDGSTDGSGAILDAYAEKDSRIRVFHQANGGVSSARNHALEKVQGEWLGFLDSDDTYHPKLLELVKAEVDASGGLDVVSFGHTKTQGMLSQRVETPAIRQRQFQDQIEVSYFREEMWSRFYRFALVRDVRFRPYSMAEDTLYSVVVGMRFSTGSVICAPLYFYRSREGSAMSSALSLKKVQDEFNAKVESIQVLLAHAARIPSTILRGESLQISECNAYRLACVPALQGEKSQVLAFRRHRWQTLKQLSTQPALPHWYRMTFAIVGTLCLPLVEKLLMEFPFRLKLFRNQVCKRLHL